MQFLTIGIRPAIVGVEIVAIAGCAGQVLERGETSLTMAAIHEMERKESKQGHVRLFGSCVRSAIERIGEGGVDAHRGQRVLRQRLQQRLDIILRRPRMPLTIIQRMQRSRLCLIRAAAHRSRALSAVLGDLNLVQARVDVQLRARRRRGTRWACGRLAIGRRHRLARRSGELEITFSLVVAVSRCVGD